MSLLKFLDDKLEMILCVVLMSSLALVLGTQVFMRYVMHSSLGWSEEFARYIFVWLVFLSISYGAHLMRHIKIDAGLYCFPKQFRPYIVIIGEILFLVFALTIVYLDFLMVKKQIMIGQLSPAMRIPMWLVYSAPLVGFSLTSIRLVQSITYYIKNLGNDDAKDDVKKA